MSVEDVTRVLVDLESQLYAIESAIESETHGIFIVKEREGYTICKPRSDEMLTRATLAEVCKAWVSSKIPENRTQLTSDASGVKKGP